MRCERGGWWVGLWILGLAAASPAVAGADETATRVAELQAKAGAVETYQADFTLTVTEDNTPSTLAGTILYQRPDKRRIEFTGAPAPEDVAQLVVSDGTVEWQYFPGRHVAHRTDWAKVKAAGAPAETLEARGPHQPFLDLKPESIRLVDTKGEAEAPQYVFEAAPAPALVAEAPFAPGTIRVVVAAADGLARHLTMTDAQGHEVLSQEYTNIRINEPVAGTPFTFTPPKDAQVVDISDERAGTAAPAPSAMEAPPTPAGPKGR